MRHVAVLARLLSVLSVTLFALLTLDRKASSNQWRGGRMNSLTRFILYHVIVGTSVGAEPCAHRRLAGRSIRRILSSSPSKGLASCSLLSFDWDESNPYTYERQNEGQKPFATTRGCDETQRCLFAPDHEIFNLLASGTGSIFPTFENRLSDWSPSIGQVLANSMIVFDDHSTMDIAGIGLYKGPAGIGEYRIVPQFLMNVSAHEAILKASASDFKMVGQYPTTEEWDDLPMSLESLWSLAYTYYPCSVIRRKEELEFPNAYAAAFSNTGKLEGTADSICEVVMEHCIGDLKQYDSMAECVEFLGSIPHHDPVCQEKFGEYTALGEGFMCKYLHHFMIQLSPRTHCAHVGKGEMADGNGVYKCVPSDCGEKLDERTGEVEPVCSAEDAEGLAQGIIYTLLFCLPSLEMQVCGANCTQAINTYLGRFAESGVIESCDPIEVTRSSSLLSVIGVDAETLYRLCSGDPLLASKATKFTSSAPIPNCYQPNEYLGSNLQCRGWDWDKVAKTIFDEWTQKRKHRRTTTSDDVATAECFVFTQLYAQYLNIDPMQMPDLAASLMNDEVQPHPNGKPLMLSHEQVSSTFKLRQVREGLAGATATFCSIPGKAAKWMQDRSFNPVVHDTLSPAHASTRAFSSLILPGLFAAVNAPPPPLQSVFDDRGLVDEDELFDSLAIESAKALLGENSMLSPLSSDFLDDIREVSKLYLTWALPDSWHRAHGYTLGVGYASKRHSIARQLKDRFPPEYMERMIQAAGLVNISGIDAAYEGMAAQTSRNPGVLASLTVDIIQFIRQDPCRLLPMWQKSPQRFIVEYARLNTPGDGFSLASDVKTSYGVRYQMHSANRDPAVFPNPLAFDPDRDLSSVLSWNFLEGEGQDSHARSCPGRSFTVQFVASYAPRYFPIALCSNDLKVYNGVEFYKESSAVNGIGEVLKTSTGSKTLLLFLHGFPDVPQVFAPIIAKLRRIINADYWILDLWSSVKNDSCKIPDYARRVVNFIESAKPNYQSIFLVGHDFGGLVAWTVAETLDNDILAGFVSFSPRPHVFGSALRTVPARNVPLSKLMGPLVGSTFLSMNNFELLADTLADETFWPEFRDEYHRMWDDVGAHTLTCVFRDNFEVIDDALGPVDLEEEKDIATDIFLINAKDDTMFHPTLYHASIGGLAVHRYQQIFHKEVHGASHQSILHYSSSEVAEHIAMFTKSVSRKRFSLWSRVTKPPQLHSSYEETVSSDTVTLYAYVLTVFVMATGLIMELTIGTLLVGKLGFGVYLFSQVMAATINLGCFFAADLITLPLFTIGLFKMGYPEVTGKLLAPIRTPEFFHHSKLFRAISFVSGIAYLVHHFGGTLLYMAVSLHEIDPLSLGFLALAVGFQHLVVFVKYLRPNMHALLLIIFELWFQFESYYVLSFATSTANVGIWMLLGAHYIWFIHVVVKMILEYHVGRQEQDLMASRASSLVMYRRSLGDSSEGDENFDPRPPRLSYRPTRQSSHADNVRVRERTNRRSSIFTESELQRLIGFEDLPNPCAIEDPSEAEEYAETSPFHSEVNESKEKEPQAADTIHEAGNVDDSEGRDK